ncbi:MAG: hypothetical protein ABJH98_17930 [Reichenbachiella sp.]|uniref:hypothetical protein n=1 Tax=Reichenbachiella sp. TaxID=2184521 RepID=UPI0032995AA8
MGTSIAKPEIKLSKAQRIKKQLKDQIGYNQKQVSVREQPGGRSWSFTFTIRDSNVDYHQLKAFANTCQSYDRCEASGEILSGGNTFTHIEISDSVKDEWSSYYLKKLESVNHLFNETSGTSVDDFTIYLNGQHMKIFYHGIPMAKSHTSLPTLALAMHLEIQKPSISIKQTDPMETLNDSKPFVVASLTNVDDLISKFDSVEINYENRISEADRTFCTETQTIYTDLTTLLKKQLAWFEKKHANCTANGAFKLSEHQGKYSVATHHRAHDLRWDQSLKYTALYSIAAIKNNLTQAQKNFVSQIRSHFENQYHIKLDLQDLETTSSVLDFTVILEHIFKETDGADLFDAGVKKINDDFHRCLHFGNVRKAKKITFSSLAYYWDGYSSNCSIHYNCDNLKQLLLALSFFDNQSTSMLSELTSIVPYDHNQGPKVSFEAIEIDTLKTITKFRFYKNGNVDVHFTTPELADQFWHIFNMDAKKARG